MLESEELKLQTSDPIRFVGGGALSKVTCQILADITGRKIETVEHAQDVGAVGAAMLVGIGRGLIPSIDKVKDFVRVKEVFTPNAENKAVYDKNYRVFKSLYPTNKKLFREINS